MKALLAIWLMICLNQTPNLNNLNEITPDVTEAISYQVLHIKKLIGQIFFHALASLLRQTAYFLSLAAWTGFGVALLNWSQQRSFLN